MPKTMAILHGINENDTASNTAKNRDHRPPAVFESFPVMGNQSATVITLRRQSKSTKGQASHAPNSPGPDGSSTDIFFYGAEMSKKRTGLVMSTEFVKLKPLLLNWLVAITVQFVNARVMLVELHTRY